MTFKKVSGVVIRIAKNAAIGSVAGGLAGHTTATSNDAPAASRSGAKLGALVGAITGVPAAPVIRSASKAARIYGRGLKATGSSVGVAMRKVEMGARKGRVIFRRIRGRIVPVKVK